MGINSYFFKNIKGELSNEGYWDLTLSSDETDCEFASLYSSNIISGETFFDFAYHIDLSKGSKNYFKEIHFNNFNSVQAVELYATSGSTLGIIEYSYNEDGKLEGLIWYLGDREEKIKEITLINPNKPTAEVTESPES